MPEAALIGMKVTIDSDTRTPPEDPDAYTPICGVAGRRRGTPGAGTNGNTYGAQYVIERHAGIGASREYVIVGTTTLRSFIYSGADAAEPAMYRVKSRRSDTESGYSITANIGM